MLFRSEHAGHIVGDPATVTVTARITDDVSGVFAYKTDNTPDGSNYSAWSSGLYLRSPSGTQRIQGTFDLRTAGGPLDGTYQATITLPQYSEQGTWVVEAVNLHDRIGNYARVETTTLTQAGYPTAVEVVRTA